MQFTVYYTESWTGEEGTAQYYAESPEQAAEFFQEDFGNTAGIDYITGDQ